MRDTVTAADRKPLPHDIQVEQELLGAILMNNQAMPLVLRHVDKGHFYEPVHREIFGIAADLIGADKPATPTTVGAFLPKDILLPGGMTLKKYLAALAAAATTIVNAPEFARIVRDLSDYRQIILLMEEMTSGWDSVDPAQVATAAIERLNEIVETRSNTSSPALDMRKAVVRAVDATALAYQNNGKTRGVSYGLRGLDDKTLGAMPADLIVIAGRPGMGKSAIALGIARNMASAGRSVMFWSGEMDDVALTNRIIADELWRPGKRLSFWQLASGKFHESEFQRYAAAARVVGEWPLWIEQQPGLTISEIAARARQWKRKRGLDALFVDHLGLVRPSSRYHGNKVNETGEVTMGLKVLAKELGIPVFLLCQLNRAAESREDKRPQLLDLRHSGDIEQDADTVLMLYRPAYYLQLKEPPAGSAEFIIWSDEMEKVHNRLDCIIGKQRAGPVGTVRLYCDISCNAVRDEFSEMSDELPLSDRELADFK